MSGLSELPPRLMRAVGRCGEEASAETAMRAFCREVRDCLRASVLLADEAGRVLARAGDYPDEKRRAHDLPMIAYMERVGTLTLCREEPFSDEEALAAEFCAYCAALILQKLKNGARAAGRAAKDAKNSIAALSFSELEAALTILNKINWADGLFIAKTLSEETGVSRAVFVNALRKLAAGGAVETRSLGVKGTYVRVLDESVLRELKKYK